MIDRPALADGGIPDFLASLEDWQGDTHTVRAAYHRALYLADRVTLMQWWADYLDRCKAG